MDENGPPAGFNTVDTYWALDEGVPLKMAEYKVIQQGSGDFEENGFFEEDGGNIYFKVDLNDDDRIRFLQDFLIQNNLRPWADDAKQKAYNDFSGNLGSKHVSSIPFGSYLETEDDMDGFELLVLSAKGEDRQKIDAAIVNFIKNVAVKQALDSYRCPHRTCGKNYWVGDSPTSGSDEFAQSIGSRWSVHFYSSEHELEGLVNGSGFMTTTERASTDELKKFIEDNKDKLNDETISLIEKVMNSDVYQKSCEIRDEALNPNPLIGHNGGPQLEAV